MPLLSQNVARRWLVAQFHEAFEREADVSKRLMERVMAPGQSFGNISAYQSGKSLSENKERMGDLRKELERRGYRPIPTYSTWEDEKTGKKYGERSYIVPDARPEDLFELGKNFEQDSVIYKTSEGALGMYYTGERPRAVLAQDAEGNPNYDVQGIKSPKKEKGQGPRPKEREQEELFSRSRGLNFSFNFDWDTEYEWDGKTPLDKEGNPDPTDLGKEKPTRKPRVKEGPSGWDTYLQQHWDGGHRKVPNTNSETRERFPKVEMLTLMKTDPKFRYRVRQDYQRRREKARGQASPAVG